MSCLLLTFLTSIALLGSSSALDRYPENLSIVERTGNLSVDCEGSPHMAVTWKMNGQILQTSRLLTMVKVDQPVAGNYTCWQNGSLLRQTYLVIREEDQSPIFQSKQIHCWTRTLTGVITCSWETHGAAFFKVRFCRRNSRIESECTYNYLNYSNSGKKHHFTFTEENYSPYAEEYKPITFIVEAVNSVSYQKVQTTFYVGNIVTPDPPQILSVKENRKRLNVTWQYPYNWIKPYSYFPLVFDIESQHIKRHDKSYKVEQEDKSILQITFPKRYKVRIRAKDEFLNSPWGEWSDWVNGVTGKDAIMKTKATGQWGKEKNMKAIAV